MAAKKVKINSKTLYKIVEEVRKRPCLWDPENSHYNIRNRISIAWDEVTTELNLPEYAVRADFCIECTRLLQNPTLVPLITYLESLIRNKWKNMRDIFKRELKRHKVKSIDTYKGKWQHFHIMRFLHKSFGVPANDSNNNNSTEEIIKVEEETEYQQSNTLDLNDETENAIFESNTFPIEEYDFEPSPTKKRRTISSEDDSDMMFLKSLAPYIRGLDPVRKLKVRSKIQDIILNEITAESFGVAFGS